MKTLVIAEHDGFALKESTMRVLSAAAFCLNPITVLVLGGATSLANSVAVVSGVDRVLFVPGTAEQQAEWLTEQVLFFCSPKEGEHPYRNILLPATAWGKNFLPRVAARLDCAPISDVIAIHPDGTCDRPIYAGNAIITVRSEDPVRCMSVRPTAFRLANTKMDSFAQINTFSQEEILLSVMPTFDASVNEEEIESVFVKSQRFPALISKKTNANQVDDLISACAIVSGGRALGSASCFLEVLGPLAKSLGAALGATRSAVDAGYAPNDWQIGQTGRVVAPKLYIAVGLSGAVQHIAGMKDSEVIVAINKDPEAPIFKVADFGLIADLFEVLPEWVALLMKDRTTLLDQVPKDSSTCHLG